MTLYLCRLFFNLNITKKPGVLHSSPGKQLKTMRRIHKNKMYKMYEY